MAYISDAPYKASSKTQTADGSGRFLRLAVVAGCALFWAAVAGVFFG